MVTRAIFDGVVIAESDDVRVVEAMPYFPLDSVHFERLEPSSTTTWCFWKGKATYSHVRGMRRVAIDAAFMYRRPWPLARRLVGCRIAFWRDVEIVDE